nr:pleckstrin homology (PH) domain-containing protein [Ipomoea batatas]
MWMSSRRGVGTSSGCSWRLPPTCEEAVAKGDTWGRPASGDDPYKLLGMLLPLNFPCGDDLAVGHLRHLQELTCLRQTLVGHLQVTLSGLPLVEQANNARLIWKGGEDTREMFFQKKKVMQAAETSKKCIELLDQLEAKLNETLKLKRKDKYYGLTAMAISLNSNEESNPSVCQEMSVKENGEGDGGGGDRKMFVGVVWNYVSEQKFLLTIERLHLHSRRHHDHNSLSTDTPSFLPIERALRQEQRDSSWASTPTARTPTAVFKSLLCKGKPIIVFYLKLNMARAQSLLMKEDGFSLVILSQDNFLIDIKVFPSSFTIKTSLGNLRISDDSLPDTHSYFMGLVPKDSKDFVRIKDQGTNSEKWFTRNEVEGSPALKLDFRLENPQY